MRDIESCDTVVISGAGFEGFLENNLLESKQIIDASLSISLLCSAGSHHSEHNDNHIQDSHIWLSIENAKMMTENIRDGLSEQYPEYKSTFNKNYIILNEKLTELSEYAKTQLDDLSCRNIITFHDGFTYLANDFNLNIVHAIEEESGSEASAAELIKLTEIIEKYGMNSIFTEINGSTSAAEIIAAETGVKTFALDMAISGESYFAAMKHNIDTLKEALE